MFFNPNAPNPNAPQTTGNITAVSRSIEDRLTALESAPVPTVNVADLEARLTVLEAVNERLKTKVAGL